MPGTLDMECPLSGTVSRGRVVKAGLSTDHGMLRSKASVSSRIEVRPSSSCVVPPVRYSIELTSAYGTSEGYEEERVRIVEQVVLGGCGGRGMLCLGLFLQ